MWDNIRDLKTAFKTLDITVLSINYSDDAIQVISWLRENIYHNKATTENYRQGIFRFYLWLKHEKNLTLHNCSRNDIFEYIEFIRNIPLEWRGNFRPLEEDGWRPFSNTVLSKKTINSNIQLIHQLFTYLHQIDYIRKNPLALRIKKIPQVRRADIDKYFTKQECVAIYRHILNLPESSKLRKELKVRIKWIFKLLIYSGCRRAEVLSANMDCIVLRDDLLWLSIIGKGYKAGAVPIIPQLEHALNEYRSFYELPLIRDKFDSEKDIPLIIKRYRNGQFEKMSVGIINYQLRSVCTELAEKVNNFEFAKKLNNVSAHWLRHTAATIQANSGVHINVVKENLRHSSIQTTAYYQHTDKKYQHEETSRKFNLDL